MRPIFSKMTSYQKLKYSVVFGWSIIIFFLIIIPYISEKGGTSADSVYLTCVVITAILLSLRYSLLKPVLKATIGGAKVVGIAYILESIFARREQHGSATLGAFVGAMLVILFFLFKNAIIATYYLIRETIELVQWKKSVGQYINSEHAATKEDSDDIK